MNISKITGFSGRYNYDSAHAPKFNGLWGRTYFVRIGRDEVLGVPVESEEKYYFPFSDEKPEDVQKIIKDRQKAELLNENGVTIYRINDCKLGLEFPFKKEDFENYSHLTKPVRSRFFENIHKLVKNKYTNDLAGRMQITFPASNPVMDERVSIFA